MGMSKGKYWRIEKEIEEIFSKKDNKLNKHEIYLILTLIRIKYVSEHSLKKLITE